MRKDLEAFYENELYAIRNLAEEFARERPKIADRLFINRETGESTDPHVERLIEGFAFLNARTRLKLEDEFPELVDALLGVLYPHYLAPIPSMAVVQFRPDPEQGEITEGYTVPRHSYLYSREVEGLPCRFRTAYPVTLWPVDVAAVRYRLPPFSEEIRLPAGTEEPEAVIQLRLRTRGGVSFGELPLDRLRFFLSGDDRTTHQLHELIFNHLAQVVVQPSGGPRDGGSALRPASAVQPVGFDREENLLPYPAHSFPGYRLLTEYFTFPYKYLFFDVDGLRESCAAAGERQLELLLVFKRADASLEERVDRDTFRLGCAPVVNLFKQQADPVRVTHLQTEYPVTPDVRHARHLEVYSVDSVTSTDLNTEETVTYEPIFACRHGAAAQDRQAYWYTTRRPSIRMNDPGTDVFLSLVDLAFNPKRPPAEVLNVHTTCTNRDLPGELRSAGGEEWQFKLEGQAPLKGIDPIVSPTPSYRIASDERRWRLVSHLVLNHLSISDREFGADALREILKLYDFAGTRTTAQQIAGIVGVSSRRKTGRVNTGGTSGFCRGIEVTVEFDPERYAGSGVFLLASVLERFLALYASINSFTQMVGRFSNSEEPFKRWPARAAERTLL